MVFVERFKIVAECGCGEHVAPVDPGILDGVDDPSAPWSPVGSITATKSLTLNGQKRHRRLEGDRCRARCAPNPRSMKGSAVWLIAFIALLCVGCQYQVSVSLDDGLRESGMMPSLEIDLVGVNDSELDRWRHYSVTEYFGVGDVFRQDADRYTMTFANTDPGPKSLHHKHPIWDVWRHKSARWLIVMAHLPGDHKDLPDQQDVRRLILSLSSKEGWPQWPTTHIDLVVKRSGVVSLTDMKPQ